MHTRTMYRAPTRATSAHRPKAGPTRAEGERSTRVIDKPPACDGARTASSRRRLERRCDAPPGVAAAARRRRRAFLAAASSLRKHAEGKSNLGNLLHTRGYRRKTQADLQEAYPLLHEAVQMSVEALGAEHIQTLISRSNLGACLRTMGREEEASSLIRAAVEGIAEYRKQLGDANPDSALLHSGMEQFEV